LYVSSQALSRLLSFSPHRHDVVVCGCVRSGQTPVLAVLDALRGSLHGDLSLSTAWVENAESLNVEVPRLIKTHMGADQVLEAGHECKVVCVVRDPADLRVSWFRHTRRLFRKVAKAQPDLFDSLFNFDLFSKQPMPNLGSFGVCFFSLSASLC